MLIGIILLFILSLSTLIVTQDDEYSDYEGGDPFIVGGRDAEWGELPYVVSIRLKTNETFFGGGHKCGGSLINKRTVLTAAHCFIDKKWHSNPQKPYGNYEIVGGNLDRYDERAASYVGRIANITVHEGYLHGLFHKKENDIALLRLDTVVLSTNPLFKVIPMIKENVSLPVNIKCTIGGWGTIAFGGRLSRYLKVAKVTLLGLKRCWITYRAMIPNILCAGDPEGSQDTCQGDSGGPFVCQGVLAGVVSFGKNCAVPEYPGVYMSVSKFRPWIMRHTNPEDYYLDDDEGEVPYGEAHVIKGIIFLVITCMWVGLLLDEG